MRKLLFLVTAWMLLNSCNQSGTTSSAGTDSTKTGSAQTKEEHNKQVALTSTKALPNWDFDKIFTETDPNVIDYNDGTMPPVKGLDSIKYYMQRGLDEFKAAFPDFKVDDLVATASGNNVMVWGIYSATWKKDYMGQKATGKSFKLPGVDYFVFSPEGKVVEHRSTSHNAEMAKQVGMKF